MNEFLASAHPFIVHFAVALTMMSAVFELLGLLFKKQHLSTTALSIGIASVPFLLAAVLTGNLAETYLASSLRGEALEEHMLYANITVWAFTVLVFGRIFLGFRKQYTNRLRLLYVVLLCAVAVVTFHTAEEGGNIIHNATEAVTED